MQQKPIPVRFFLTLPDKSALLAPQPDLYFQPEAKGSDSGVTVVIDESQTYQAMDGYGAALTDSSAYVLSRLPEKAREAALRDLFDPKTGIGFSILRVCVGASDFSAKGSFTYRDLKPSESDPELTRFSIAPDKEYTLPLLQQIRKINPTLRIMASPWSAPAWMKTSKKLNGGWLDWPAYPAFAKYLVKFIQAYQKEGIPIWSLSVQNEPRHETDSYPSMRMEPRDQARFIRDHLGPTLAEAQLTPKIFAWDHNWDGVEFPLEVLADAGARKYIAGVAFHGYGGEPKAQARIQQAFPDQEIHFTESSGGAWATDFGGNIRWDMENLLVGSVRYGSRSVLKWNLALDEKYGPTNGGCNNCRGIVTVHSATGAVTRNEEYYAFGHSSKFVRPDARRIASSEVAGIAQVAFRNPDSSRVWVACNTTGEAKSVTLRWNKNSLALQMAPGALMTLLW